MRSLSSLLAAGLVLAAAPAHGEGRSPSLRLLVQELAVAKDLDEKAIEAEIEAIFVKK